MTLLRPRVVKVTGPQNPTSDPSFGSRIYAFPRRFQGHIFPGSSLGLPQCSYHLTSSLFLGALEIGSRHLNPECVGTYRPRLGPLVCPLQVTLGKRSPLSGPYLFTIITPVIPVVKSTYENSSYHLQHTLSGHVLQWTGS